MYAWRNGADGLGVIGQLIIFFIFGRLTHAFGLRYEQMQIDWLAAVIAQIETMSGRDLVDQNDLPDLGLPPVSQNVKRRF